MVCFHFRTLSVETIRQPHCHRQSPKLDGCIKVLRVEKTTSLLLLGFVQLYHKNLEIPTPNTVIILKLELYCFTTE